VFQIIKPWWIGFCALRKLQNLYSEFLMSINVETIFGDNRVSLDLVMIAIKNSEHDSGIFMDMYKPF
jgi:hypothetical protein